MAIDTHEFKTKLEAMLAEITASLAEIGIHDPTNPENWVAVPEGVGVGEADPNVGADRAEDWNDRRATLAELETRYNNIARALKKIENDTYGVCEISGSSIEEERLEANPAARTCAAHMNEEAQLPR